MRSEAIVYIKKTCGPKLKLGLDGTNLSAN
jgi:hypothetical protein